LKQVSAYAQQVQQYQLQLQQYANQVKNTVARWRKSGSRRKGR
jgi:conjugal transfer/entry exclusion protein